MFCVPPVNSLIHDWRWVDWMTVALGQQFNIATSRLHRACPRYEVYNTTKNAPPLQLAFLLRKTSLYSTVGRPPQTQYSKSNLTRKENVFGTDRKGSKHFQNWQSVVIIQVTGRDRWKTNYAYLAYVALHCPYEVLQSKCSRRHRCEMWNVAWYLDF